MDAQLRPEHGPVRDPDQIQMYPDRDTIAQLLPARRFVCLFLLYDCLRESLDI